LGSASQARRHLASIARELPISAVEDPDERRDDSDIPERVDAMTPPGHDAQRDRQELLTMDERSRVHVGDNSSSASGDTP
jgi:hypothetical protein